MATYFVTHLSPLTVAIIAAPFIGADLARAATARLIDLFRFDRRMLLPVRRWYGTGARVLALWDPQLDAYEVDGWERYGRGSVWVRAVPVNRPDGDLRWFPLEALIAHEVPVFRPHLDRGVPRLTRYIPARAA